MRYLNKALIIITLILPLLFSLILGICGGLPVGEPVGIIKILILCFNMLFVVWVICILWILTDKVYTIIYHPEYYSMVLENGDTFITKKTPSNYNYMSLNKAYPRL